MTPWFTQAAFGTALAAFAALAVVVVITLPLPQWAAAGIMVLSVLLALGAAARRFGLVSSATITLVAWLLAVPALILLLG